jgi:hypothetical protein
MDDLTTEIQYINVGEVANDGTGDPQRTAWIKANHNFALIQPGGVTQLLAGDNISLSPTIGTGIVTVTAAGGSGIPHTPNGSVQWDNSGSFGGSNLIYDGVKDFTLNTGNVGILTTYIYPPGDEPDQPALPRAWRWPVIEWNQAAIGQLPAIDISNAPYSAYSATIVSNCDYTSGGWKYTQNNIGAANYNQALGTHYFYTATGSGAAVGGAISEWDLQLTVNASGVRVGVESATPPNPTGVPRLIAQSDGTVHAAQVAQADNLATWNVGYLEMPISGNTTTTLNDSGKLLYQAGGGTFTVPTAAGLYPFGTVLTFYTAGTGGRLIFSDASNQVGTGLSGLLYGWDILPWGMATAIYLSDGTWALNGVQVVQRLVP